MKKLLIIVLVIAASIVATHQLSSDFQTWTSDFLGIGEHKLPVYQWTDNKGVTHVTTHKPEGNLPYTVQHFLTIEKITPRSKQP